MENAPTPLIGLMDLHGSEDAPITTSKSKLSILDSLFDASLIILYISKLLILLYVCYRLGQQPMHLEKCAAYLKKVFRFHLLPPVL